MLNTHPLYDDFYFSSLETAQTVAKPDEMLAETYYLILLAGLCSGDPEVLPEPPYDDIDEKFVENANEFSVNMYKRLVTQGGNIFFCSACLTSSLTLILEGSSGKTESEINNTMGYKMNGLWRNSVREAFAIQNKRIKQSQSEIANGLFIQRNPWESPSNFVNRFQHMYNTRVKEVDFLGNPQQTVWEINELVRSETRGHIKNLLERIDERNQMLLINTINFKTKFHGVFDLNRTRKARFHNHGVEDQQIDIFMMEKQSGSYQVANSYDFRALRLPSGHKNSANMSLWILLPHKTESLSDVEDGLSAATFKEVRENFEETNIKVSIPKIKFDFIRDIKKDLQRLGIRLAFSAEDADFSNISPKNKLSLTQVIQKSIVELNEQSPGDGSTSQDKTDVDAEKPLCDQPFIADHPFIFCVMDDHTGLILKIGRVFQF